MQRETSTMYISIRRTLTCTCQYKDDAGQIFTFSGKVAFFALCPVQVGYLTMPRAAILHFLKSKKGLAKQASLSRGGGADTDQRNPDEHDPPWNLYYAVTYDVYCVGCGSATT